MLIFNFLKNQKQFLRNNAQKKTQTFTRQKKRLLEISEEYGNVSPVEKKQKPKYNTFINLAINLGKVEPLNILQGVRDLISFIDEKIAARADEANEEYSRENQGKILCYS